MRLPDPAPEPVEESPGSIFPSWNILYISVIVYTLALIALLYLFTRWFDFSLQ